MIILVGPPRTGKSTLKNDIEKYLGNHLCGNLPINCEFIYYETIPKLGILCDGIEDISRSKNTNQALVNFIKYNQSFIAATNYIEKVNKKLLEYCRVIQMNHIF